MFRPTPYETDPRVRKYIVPVRIVRTTGNVENPEAMLEARPAQIGLERPPFWPACKLTNEKGERASILVDFGCEFRGSLRLYSWYLKSATKRVNLKIRFGESVSEAMTPWPEKGSTNDHANRDVVMNVGFLSANETNESGYRFALIELMDDDCSIDLYMIQGVMIDRNLERLGTFNSSCQRVNDIFETSVYTAYLNMQEYLWDGIKRDRLVWCGDIYPSELTILAAFGAHEVLKKSLDIHSLITPPTGWMNGYPSYSLWWVLSHDLFYMASGDIDYLKQNHDYIKSVIHHITDHVDEDGVETLPQKFLDWPSSTNPEALHSGMQALFAIFFERAAYLMREMGDEETAKFCDDYHAKVSKVHLPHGNNKQAAAMLGLSGIEDVKKMNEEVIVPGGGHGYSTFMGYTILSAKALAGDMTRALSDMREYWGGMLDMGATTFWEDFDLDWMENATPITEPVPEGKVDIHGDYGAYCYLKLRHSLCHAWASGPAPFLMKYVLGIQILEPGCKKIAIKPDLGDLDWAEGTYPTPYGLIKVRHEKTADGIKSTVEVPEGVEVVK